MFKFLKKKQVEEETEERVREEVGPSQPPFVGGDVPRYKKRPNLVFIGSGKGGVGKSLLASNMVVVVAALSPFKVYGVDLDLDNFTLTKVLIPPGFLEKLVRSDINYVNLASVLRTGVVEKGSVIPIVSAKTLACNGAQVGVKYRIIPAYNLLRQKEQEVALRTLTVRLLISGVNELVNYFENKRKEDSDIVVIFDGKQKSNIGIEYEPLYRILLDYSDVFILPVEPPILSFSEIITPYRNVLDKLVLVINRVDPASLPKVQMLVKDAVERSIPVFVMPKVPDDGDLFRTKYMPPALKSITRPTAFHAMGIAYYLNLLDDEMVRSYGCTGVYTLLKKYKRLYDIMA